MPPPDGRAAADWVTAGAVTVRSPGRVNLFLGVGDVAEDGRHEVLTVVHTVSLFDQITVRADDGLSVTLTGEGSAVLPTDSANLAWRAAQLLAEHVGREPDLAIAIDRSIPVGGGLAGGSADAAGVLVAVNTLWELGLARRDLHALAAELGAGVPFALHGGTALGTGQGERLATVLARSTFHWLLAFAAGGLGAAEVFAETDRLRAGGAAGGPPGRDDPEPVLAALASGDPRRLAPLLANDLQPAVFRRVPAARRTLGAGLEAGALAGVVSGSGPTCAFLCSSAAVAADVGAQLAGAGVCRTVRAVSGPVPGARVVPTPSAV